MDGAVARHGEEDQLERAKGPQIAEGMAWLLRRPRPFRGNPCADQCLGCQYRGHREPERCRSTDVAHTL